MVQSFLLGGILVALIVGSIAVVERINHLCSLIQQESDRHIENQKGLAELIMQVRDRLPKEE